MKITLCGSTRFIDAFNRWNQVLTEAGHLVYSVCAVTSQTAAPIDANTKLVLDAVHMGKIEDSEAIFVITGPFPRSTAELPYIGESTRREIYFADIRDKAIFYDHRIDEGFLTPLVSV